MKIKSMVVMNMGVFMGVGLYVGTLTLVIVLLDQGHSISGEPSASRYY